MYMMKKILLLAGIVSLAACTNDPEETFSQGGGSSAGVKVIYDAEGAVEGQLIVKFRPSAADSLAAALASASATRAGFATADELLAAVGVDGLRPLFGSDPRFGSATALSVCTNGTWLPSTSRFPCVKWSAN